MTVSTVKSPKVRVRVRVCPQTSRRVPRCLVTWRALSCHRFRRKRILRHETNPGSPRPSPHHVRQVLELLTWTGNGSGVGLSVDGVGIPVAPQVSADGVVSFNPQRVAIAGPKTVVIEVASNQALLCTYKITTATETATANVASQAVVIPENATAPVDIILESSTDLVTWTAAVAGSYAPSTSKRFFRVLAAARQIPRTRTR